MATIISEFRVPVTIDGDNDSLDIDGTAYTITQGDYADLHAVAAVVAAKLNATAPASIKATWTMTYEDDGSDRGKWILSCDSGFTYVLDDNGGLLRCLFGWTTLPTAGGTYTYTSDVESSYIFTPQHALGETLGFLPGGYEADTDTQMAEQAIAMDGTPHTTLIGVSTWVRPIVPVLLDPSDVLWLRRWWKVVKDGRKFKFLQDRTVVTEYDEESNIWGYHYVVLDISSIKQRGHMRWSTSNTFTAQFLFRWHP